MPFFLHLSIRSFIEVRKLFFIMFPLIFVYVYVQLYYRYTTLCICQYRYVIGVVGVGNCCCGVPSASFLRQFEAILSDFVNRCSKYVV